MSNYQRILVGVDLGEETEKILRRAALLARLNDAPVTVLHVIEYKPKFHPYSLDRVPSVDVSTKHAHEARDRITELVTQADIEGAEIRVVQGYRREEIPRIASEEQADLIVLGSHGWHRITGVLGSTPDRIVHRAECDVLVVRTQDLSKPEQGSEPYKRILVATDLSEHSTSAAKRGAHLAKGCQAHLMLLHVVEHFAVDRSNVLIAPEDQDPAVFRRDHAIEKLTSLAKDIEQRDAEQEIVLTTRTAKREIPSFAEQHHVDLISVGSHGLHGLEALLGSTADGVLHRARCDVLVVRARI